MFNVDSNPTARGWGGSNIWLGTVKMQLESPNEREIWSQSEQPWLILVVKYARTHMHSEVLGLSSLWLQAQTLIKWLNDPWTELPIQRLQSLHLLITPLFNIKRKCPTLQKIRSKVVPLILSDALIRRWWLSFPVLMIYKEDALYVIFNQ